MLHKALLQRVEAVTFAEPFDSCDSTAVQTGGQQQTRVHSLSVDENGASATLALVAPLLGPGELETFSQEVE